MFKQLEYFKYVMDKFIKPEYDGITFRFKEFERIGLYYVLPVICSVNPNHVNESQIRRISNHSTTLFKIVGFDDDVFCLRLDIKLIFKHTSDG